MRSRLLVVGSATVLALSVSLGWYSRRSTATPPLSTVSKPLAAASLPITRVVLFTSGVGFFRREGRVEGTARVDLAFPVTAINDLLKSLVLEDAGGRAGIISLDGAIPLERTLQSFGLDLTYNPTFGEILNQARGEKAELTLARDTKIIGTIVGMESQRHPGGKTEIERLNVLGPKGIQSIALAHVSAVHFLNPTLEAEFERALEILAQAHEIGKKTVSLSFAGIGSRPVRVGYVVENPIWKTSYRLVLGPAEKAFLQGWALVENNGEDDWKGVRLVLVSGRPLSFEMELYQPLYVPRPTVEPELFASLRLVLVSGRPLSFEMELYQPLYVPRPTVEPELFASLRPPAYNGPLIPGGGIGGLGGIAGAAGLAGLGGLGGGKAGDRSAAGTMDGEGPLAGFLARSRYQGGPFGLSGGGLQPASRLSYDEYQKRKSQNNKSSGEDQGPKGDSSDAAAAGKGVESMARGEEIGASFRYTIDQKVSLARNKSSLIPIIGQDVAVTRLSIFNESVQSKFPLLGVRFKNTSGNHLMQGPISVYEGNDYAGDARIQDLQPNEERLLSFGVDLGVEVKTEKKALPEQLVSLRIVKGILQAGTRFRESKTYEIANRADQNRSLVIEHPIRGDWQLGGSTPPKERSRDAYRFEFPVSRGKSLRHRVIEEKIATRDIDLLTADAQDLRVLLASKVGASKVREALQKLLDLRDQYHSVEAEKNAALQRLKSMTDDEARLRANLGVLPPASTAYKRCLEKLDKRESEIEDVGKRLQRINETEAREQKELEDYAHNLSVE